ncbi:MAG: ABC transporter permease, partial [Lachnospiraceae bacterium]
MGISQALVILAGGINLSIGAVMAFSTVLCGNMLLKDSGVPIIVPVVLILLTGAVIGLLNGLMVTKLHIPPFIATFAMMYACRGLAWVYLRNQILYPLNENFRVIAMGRLFQIGGFTVTMPMVIAGIFLLVFFFLLKRTNWGRKLYFLGSNPTAARFSGIAVDKLLIMVYMLSCTIAAFGGLMYVARLNACEPGLATKTHFEAITVSLIGGFAMAGGYGNIWGVAGGAIVVYA